MVSRKAGVEQEKDVERKASQLFAQAMTEYKRKDYRKALETLTESILAKSQVEPPRSCSKYYLYRGNCFKYLMEYDKSLLDYTLAINNPDSEKEKPLYLMNRGILQRMVGRLQESLGDFEEAIRLDRNNSALYLNRGLTYYDMNKKDLAIQDYTEAIRLSKDGSSERFKSFFHRGNTLRECGKIEESIADLSQAAELDPTNAPVQNNLGLSLFELKKFQAAVQRFTSAIEIDPTIAIYYNNRGLAYYQLERYDESLQDFSQALQRDPNDGNTYFNRGNTFLAMKKYKEALDDFNKAINKVETDENYYHCKGMAYEEMKEIDQAIDMFKKALENNPRFIPSLYHLGLMYHANGSLFEAKKCFTKVLKIKKDRRVFESRGLVYQDLLYYDLAVEDFTSAIRLAPEYPLNYFYRGKSFLWLGKYTEAINDFNKAFELGCMDSQVFNARAMAFKYLGRYEYAIKDLDKAISEDEGNVEYLFNRSQCLFDLHKYEESIKDLTLAINIEREESKLYYLRGLAYYELKQFKDSVRDLKRSLRIKSSAAYSHDCYYHIGIAYCNMGKYEKAVASFSSAIKCTDQDFPVYYHERAKSYQHLQQNEQALADFTKVIELQPHNAHAFFRRAFAFKALDRFDEAAEDFEKAKSLQPNNINLVVNYNKIYDVAYIMLCEPGEEPI